MSDRHFESAYWSVLGELTAPQQIPLDRLRAMLVTFEGANGNPKLQARMLITNLLNVEWDWPAWYGHAPKEETLAAEADDEFEPDPADIRLAMARAISERIMNLAYNLERREQLLDPQFVAMCPVWRFRWCGDPAAPTHCKGFDGQKLHVSQAATVFPQFPCGYLNCGCKVFATAT